MGNRWGNSEQVRLYLLGAPKPLQMVTAAMKLKDAYSLEGTDSIFKSRDITLPTKVHLVKDKVFQWSCMDLRVGL